MHFSTVDDFIAALDRFERPMVVIAHQDDEVTFGGVLGRMSEKVRMVWVTNGDGLYFQTDLPPKDYGEIRKAEAIKSVAAVGVSEKQLECLDFSEVEIYRRFGYVTENPSAAIYTKPFFQKIADAVKDRVFETRPEVVFTCAFQGGNPEHDLTHFFTRLALDAYEKETGVEVPLIHVPMYEYVILIAQRFHPLYPGRRWQYRISAAELEKKRGMIEAYPSQIQLFEGFQKVMTSVGWLATLTRGRPMTIEEYLSREEFGPIPRSWNYLKNPHTFDAANYIGDHFAGIPVSFAKSVRPILAQFPRAV